MSVLILNKTIIEIKLTILLEKNSPKKQIFLHLQTMSIHIKEVKSKQDLEAFIKFPMNLYKDNNYYVPPFIKEEKETLDVSKNPVFKDAVARYFIAE